VMAAIRSKNTKPERAVRSALRLAGATGYRVHVPHLPGKPDLAFTRWRVAVFIDGAYWHGHPDHFHASSAAPYWREKIARTQQRDALANERLRDDGWLVLRFWDFEVKADVAAVAAQIIEALRRAGWTERVSSQLPRAY
jgi:DNA mismatch endonuclease, patch repair protein